MDKLTNYQYRAARATVILHEQYMREFLNSWRSAKAAEVVLPKSENPAYVSLEALLKHVLGCGRHYMVWICEMLELPDPEIKLPPEVDAIEAEAESYLEHLFQQWRTPLAEVSEERFYKPEYTSGWGFNYCIDAMLEHAVMHPILHRFQLEELMEEK